ncbi:glycosyltransferase [uncultured Dubosiella sp.]|uniref:glycosyltransferase n=1 Tax=uncultured Dubosiella sp. TaxID=1937011 RepID=UPI00266F2EC8|nr:glycosyltransferase [uncultured Dubosiella sp.]
MASVKESVSVAMAAYNGEKYIQAQIQSILSQLGPEDEIVISVDPSNDRTIERIEAFGDSQTNPVHQPR